MYRLYMLFLLKMYNFCSCSKIIFIFGKIVSMFVSYGFFDSWNYRLWFLRNWNMTVLKKTDLWCLEIPRNTWFLQEIKIFQNIVAVLTRYLPSRFISIFVRAPWPLGEIPRSMCQFTLAAMKNQFNSYAITPSKFMEFRLLVTSFLCMSTVWTLGANTSVIYEWLKLIPKCISGISISYQSSDAFFRTLCFKRFIYI